MQPLISTTQLIRDSWQHYTKFWKENVRITVLAFIPSLIISTIQIITAQTNGKLDTVGLILTIPLAVASFVASLWMGIVLPMNILKQDGGQIKNAKPWYLYILPQIWIGILTGIVVMIGFFLFILPGIWLSVAIGYATYLLLEDDVHGSKALDTSYRLVKGRWWSTFLRMLGVTFTFGLAALVLIAIAAGLTAALGGGFKALTDANPNPTLDATSSALVNLIVAIATPLFVGASVKLFHSLKASAPSNP